MASPHHPPSAPTPLVALLLRTSHSPTSWSFKLTPPTLEVLVFSLYFWISASVFAFTSFCEFRLFQAILIPWGFSSSYCELTKQEKVYLFLFIQCRMFCAGISTRFPLPSYPYKQVSQCRVHYICWKNSLDSSESGLPRWRSSKDLPMWKTQEMQV